MNWLAHLYLSEPSPAFRLGNLFPDLLSFPELASLPSEYQPGIEQHRRIDAFTDSHPVVRRSIQRIEPPLRRFGGILCDLFYDHFLANDWSAYSDEPLPDFARAVYASFDTLHGTLSPEALSRLKQMETDDWLCSYRELSGMARALERIGARFRRPVPLVHAIPLLEQHYDAFRADFQAFFPELRSHVASSPRPAAGA